MQVLHQRKNWYGRSLFQLPSTKTQERRYVLESLALVSSQNARKSLQFPTIRVIKYRGRGELSSHRTPTSVNDACHAGLHHRFLQRPGRWAREVPLLPHSHYRQDSTLPALRIRHNGTATLPVYGRWKRD